MEMMKDKEQVGKLALKAGSWYVISNIALKAIAIITTPIFTRMMSTAEYGTVNTFNSWHSLLLPVFSLNLTYSIGRAKLDFPGKIEKFIGSLQLLAFLFSAVVSIILITFINPVSAYFELSQFEFVLLLVYLLFGITITFRQNGYKYTYQYKQNIAITWYTALSTTILSILLILLINENKADLRIIGITIPIVVLSVFFWIRNIKNGIVGINFEFWKYALIISIPLIFHNISMHILSQSDRIVITKIWGKSSTALYSLAYTYGVLLHIVTNAISEGWLPWFHDSFYAKQFDDIKKNVKPLIVLICYIGLACAALAPEAMLILGGKKYAGSVPCVPPVALGVVCQYVYTQYINIELHLKKTVYVSAGTIIAAFFNIITNLIFIPKYGFVAAAYTTLASYFLLLVIHYSITRFVFKVNIYDNRFMFGALIVTAVVMGIVVLTYNHAIIRFTLIFIGFASFLFIFRKYIKDGYKKILLRFANKKTEKDLK